MIATLTILCRFNFISCSPTSKEYQETFTSVITALPYVLQLDILGQVFSSRRTEICRGDFGLSSYDIIASFYLKLGISAMGIKDYYGSYHKKAYRRAIYQSLCITEHAYTKPGMFIGSWDFDIKLKIYKYNLRNATFQNHIASTRRSIEVTCPDIICIKDTISEQLKNYEWKVTKWTSHWKNVNYASKCPNVKVIEVFGCFIEGHDTLVSIVRDWKSNKKMHNVELIVEDGLTLDAYRKLCKVKPKGMELTPRIVVSLGKWNKGEKMDYSALKYVYKLLIFEADLCNLNLCQMSNLKKLEVSLLSDKNINLFTKYVLEPLKNMKKLEYLYFNGKNLSHKQNLNDYLPKSLKTLCCASFRKVKLTIPPNLEELVLYSGRYELDMVLSKAVIWKEWSAKVTQSNKWCNISKVETLDLRFFNNH